MGKINPKLVHTKKFCPKIISLICLDDWSLIIPKSKTPNQNITSLSSQSHWVD